ncbi:zinc ion binding protein [Actinidia rufa]|uniref:Zinc ion binding protein n=1 Tax=Actinidia rufa TaxID=165716 RepID=A0A7J0F485_9ERIC|nr:zinc ion binding protein [Actinidia rufa]
MARIGADKRVQSPSTQRSNLEQVLALADDAQSCCGSNYDKEWRAEDQRGGAGTSDPPSPGGAGRDCGKEGRRNLACCFCRTADTSALPVPVWCRSVFALPQLYCTTPKNASGQRAVPLDGTRLWGGCGAENSHLMPCFLTCTRSTFISLGNHQSSLDLKMERSCPGKLSATRWCRDCGKEDQRGGVGIVGRRHLACCFRRADTSASAYVVSVFCRSKLAPAVTVPPPRTLKNIREISFVLG